MRVALTMTISLAVTCPAIGAAGNPAQYFETHVRPLLAERCFECHGAKKQKGGLRLDGKEAFERGGDNGVVVVAGDPEQSRVVTAIRHTDPDFKMPPKEKLSDREIATITAWIKAGAHYPDDRKQAGPAHNENAGPTLRGGKFKITDEDRTWWAFQPIKRPESPRVKNTRQIANEIDALLLDRLEKKKLSLNPVANRRELIRRAYFDLIGLPPAPEIVEAFEKDHSPDAWARLIDRLLDSPQYGERWGRHWLDVVRYAESNGYERDGAKPHAWRYRDYVIRSFNADKPYDQFVLEQLAGDELGGSFNADAIVATGYYRLHVWDDEPDSTLAAEFDDLDDIMVTTSAAFIGLTVGCARCHDHKFDPVSQADYYQMLAFFRSINPYGLHHKGGGGRGTGKITRPLASASEVAAWEAKQQSRLKPLREQHAGEQNSDAKKKLEAAIKTIESEAPPHGIALAVNEDPVKPTHLFHRGDVQSPRAEVQPAFLSILGGQSPGDADRSPTTSTSGRRLALAKWVTQPGHPLTARVFVNRLWQHHFGQGLVKTPNDFGRTGMKPSHPELLDYLAAEFTDGGWQIKRMHKLIMLSHAYQMSSSANRREAVAADEGNELFWRQNPRRAEAEVLRDTILSVSGSLSLKMGGPSFFPTLPKEVHATQDAAGKGWTDSPPDEQNRRSIYIFVKRALLSPLLESFDYTTTTVPVGARSVTTVAPQALMLLNDGFVQQQASRFAERLRKEAGESDAAQVKRAFALAVQRSPSKRELAAALRMLDEQRKLTVGPGSEVKGVALRNYCVAMLNLNEVIYVD